MERVFVRCEECDYYSKSTGECRYNAPTIVDKVGLRIFPVVFRNDWCADGFCSSKMVMNTN